MKVLFNIRDGFLVEQETVTQGSVGIPITFEFSEEWNGLAKEAVFQAGAVSIAVPLLESNETVIPWEVCENAHEFLQVGVKGVNDTATVVIPTVWCDIGLVKHGADPDDAENAQPPTPSAQEQILAYAQSAAESARAAADSAAETSAVTVKAAEDAARAATDAASSANGFSFAALGYRNDAEGFKTEAEGYKSSAKDFASSAEDHERTAAIIAGRASDYADDAEKAAIAAADSADEAKTAAESFDASHLKDVAISTDGNSATFTRQDGTTTTFSPQTGTSYDDTEIRAELAETAGNVTELQSAVASQSEEITKHDTRITALEEEPKVPETLVKQVEDNRKNLERMWKLNQGISYEFEADDAAAYSKTVPSGAMEMDVKTIGGDSIVWNQYFDVTKCTSKNGVTVSVSGGTVTLNGTATARALIPLGNAPRIAGHKYMVRGIPYTATTTTHCITLFGSQVAADRIITATEGTNVSAYIDVFSGVTVDEIAFAPVLCDLTVMFGAGNEPTTVEEFNSIFPSDYYPYSEPTIVSADVDEVVVQKNHWGGESSFGPGLVRESLSLDHSKTYRLSFYVSSDFAYESETWLVSLRLNGSGRVNINNTEVQAGKTYSTRFAGFDAVRFSHRAFTRGTISKVRITNDDEDITIPVPAAIRNIEGYGWSAGSVYNYVDFERKKFVKRVGRVKFDDAPWKYNTTYFSIPMFYFSFVDKKATAQYATDVTYGYSVGAPTEYGLYSVNNTSMYISDGECTSVEQFVGKNIGKSVYYELAEPVEIDISEYLDAEFENISVESGGIVTFHQSADGICLPVPNAEEYLIALNEVTA